MAAKEVSLSGLETEIWKMVENGEFLQAEVQLGRILSEQVSSLELLPLLELEGYVREQQNHPEVAQESYAEAIKLLESHGLSDHVRQYVRLTNNLAFLFKTEEDFDEAETWFLKGLEVAFQALGPDDPITTSVFNNVGVLYENLEHLEQASEMHQRALEGRLAAANGAGNKDVAESYAQLAFILAKRKKIDDSQHHYELAMKIVDTLSESEKEEFAAMKEKWAGLVESIDS